MGNWIQVESDDQIHLCSTILQNSRPRYKGSLTFNNLSNLLGQTNDDDGSDMFEMSLYQDDDSSDYDLVLVEYLSLKRDNKGAATRRHWCLTFGVSPATKKTASQLYQLLKAEVRQQMKDDPSKSFWYVHLDADTFASGSLFDQVVQLFFADSSVQKSGAQSEPLYAAFRNFAKETKLLHRYQIQKIN